MKYIRLYENFDCMNYSIKFVDRVELELMNMLKTSRSEKFDDWEVAIIDRIPDETKVDFIRYSGRSAILYTHNGYSSMILTKYPDEYYTLAGFNRSISINRTGPYMYAILIDGKDSFRELCYIIKDNIVIN